MTSGQDAHTRSDLDFLARWERMSPRDTGAMLRASLLRRTSPWLVRKAEEKIPAAVVPVEA
ncbi:hypothetical protein GOB85_05425 [Acetobacter sp. LMG 1636]|uniref:Uncharacterized protein n=2 Tax=Acetobacter fallax TaxID=1737473 RepID=A0ABX0K927_9PROT|nr:hypothetical protein [Acetobacter fallax]NHO35565.1 hypothetical protein [Acetobacter fallax]